jgi:hypothetical protein
MKLTLCRGLLFTAPLIPASSAEHSGPIPHPFLHVQKLERGSDVSVSIADDASSASTVHADNRTSRDSPSSVPLMETVPETEDDKICMMTTRLACNQAIESSYWRMDNNSDVGLLTGYVLYRLPIELEFMDLDTFSR